MKLWGWLDAERADPIGGQPAVDAWLAKQVGLESLKETPGVEFDETKKRASKLTAPARNALVKIAGDDFSEDAGVRASRSLGLGYPDLLERRSGKVRAMCDAVVFPRKADEVEAIMQVAVAHRFRVTPCGGGTNVVGGFRGGEDKRPWVIVDTTHLNAIVDISEEDRTVTAEAGVPLAFLDEKLSHANLTLGHYPPSFEGATLGGALMANGSGQRSDRYGRMADNLISARIATPSGPWATESFRHASAGPWAGGLAVGSEGMFGILTDATFRLHEAPEHIEDRAWLMPSFAAAQEAVRKLTQEGHKLAMLRIWDEDETEFVTGLRLARAGLGRPPYLERMALLLKRAPARGALVIAGFEGAKRGTPSAFRQAAQFFREGKGTSLGVRAGAAWRRGRYEQPFLRESMMARGLGADAFETAAPWSRLAKLRKAVKEAVKEATNRTLGKGEGKPVVFAHVSHCYTEGANLYVTTIFPRNDEPLEQWRTIKRAAMEAIVENGGTISHQHGLGAEHATWLASEKGEAGVRLLDAVRQELDPKGVMAVGAAEAFRQRAR